MNLDYSTLYGFGSDLYQEDFDNLYHWSSETKFDFGVLNPKFFVSYIDKNTGEISTGKCPAECTRCYGSVNGKCYTPATDYVMNEEYAKLSNGYYLKVPPTNSTIDKIKLNLNSGIINTKGKTLTFWVKLWGVLRSSNEDCSVIINISNISSSYLCYDAVNKILYFIVNGAYKVFKDLTFFENLGKWTFISISNYNAFSTYKYFPSMTNIFVFNGDLPKQETTIAPQGISFEVIEFPTQIAAMYADLRIYDTFILQPLGIINGSDATLALHLLQSFSLSHKSDNTKCLNDTDLLGQTKADIGLICSNDYNPYFDKINKCNEGSYMNKVDPLNPVCKSNIIIN